MMSKFKLLTDEIVAERLAEKGWIEGCDNEHARNQVLAHYDCEITDQWQNPDFSIYEESTSDGYSVWIASADTNRINISEDVYYYDGDLSDVLYEAIPDYNRIYCDCEDIIEDAITRHYEYLLDRLDEEARNELLDEGYTEKIDYPVNALQWLEMVSQHYLLHCTSKDYPGFLNIDTTEGYKWRKFSSEVIQDLKRYRVVVEHYGLKIQRSSASEIMFVLLNTEEGTV
jgi:hypothetical protein